MTHGQYMTWPRGMAVAETAWSPIAKKDWVDFTNRVEKHFCRMDSAQINYARSMYDAIFNGTRDGNNELLIQLSTEVGGIDIHYTFDDADPNDSYPKYETPLTVPGGAVNLTVATYRNGQKMGKQIEWPIAVLESRTP